MECISACLVVLFTSVSAIVYSQQCSTAGPLTANTVSNNSSTGTFGWSSLGNTILSDNSYTSAGTFLGLLSHANSNYLVFKNFGFAIPAGAAVCGIAVTREASVDGLLVGSSVRDNSVQIVKNNAITGDNRALPGNWTGGDGSVTWGDDGDDWGESWTAEDINSSDFGVAVSVRAGAGLASLFLTAKIDRLSITVYYNLVLPVKLESFTAKAVEDKVHLNWTTSYESNNQYFLVQRSGSSKQWTTIDTVKSAGNGNIKQNYQAVDEQPDNINYYRLVQTNANGQTSVSATVMVRVEEDMKAIHIYPNPAKRQVSIKHGGNVESVNMLYMDGKSISIMVNKTDKNIWYLELPALPEGVYLLQIVKDGIVSHHRVFVDK